jgi:hypothetical protein
VVGDEATHAIHLYDLHITIDGAPCITGGGYPLGRGRLRSWCLIGWLCRCVDYRLRSRRCCRRLLPALCYKRKNIFFGDAAILSAARECIQLAQADALLCGNIAYERAVETVAV